MDAIKEYARYLIAAAMLSLGIVGMLLGPSWAWLGLVGFVAIAVADFAAGPDHSQRSHVSAAVCEAILFIQLPLTWALWLSFAHLISLGTLTPMTTLTAILSVGFLTALGSLPSASHVSLRGMCPCVSPVVKFRLASALLYVIDYRRCKRTAPRPLEKRAE
ncbi:MAG TPA: hypothetical protein EYQ84_09590 [Nitrospinaceae bacterium]|nr:hypothetical protein [Nitrospinaceae bacterium]